MVLGGKYVEEPAPPTLGAAAWFLDGTAPLLATMAALDPEAPCWNFGPPPRTAGFWLRRQAHEHAIHLIDASQASGRAAPDLGADIMLDGVDEVLTMFTPRQLRLERMQQPEKAVSFHVPGQPACPRVAGRWARDPRRHPSPRRCQTCTSASGAGPTSKMRPSSMVTLPWPFASSAAR